MLTSRTETRKNTPRVIALFATLSCSLVVACTSTASTRAHPSNTGDTAAAQATKDDDLQAALDKLQESIHHPDGPFRASFRKSGSDGFFSAFVAEISANGITGQQIDKRQGRQGQQDAHYEGTITKK